MSDARQSRPQRQSILLILLVAAITTPAALALGWYRLTGDPTFQPLALTVERLETSEGYSGTPRAKALIRAGDTPLRRRQAELLERRVRAAFAMKNVEIDIRIATGSGDDPTAITYSVGRNSFGPFGAEDAARGVHDTMQALSLVGEPARPALRHRW
ncbi:hypothetical protein [Tropicimonas sp.]|uniref:hypothetical protein n=1 Tax=Tropicimonas sp. TaxID=2067044 RepID=UPI003A89262D